MLVEELDVPVVDPLGDVLADLVGSPALDHVESRPPVLRLRAAGGADKERILQLSLQVVLLDMVGKRGGYLSRGSLSAWGVFFDRVRLNRPQGGAHYYFGYPTPVKPDQPTYAPWGNRSRRSSALANFCQRSLASRDSSVGDGAVGRLR
jgi:hypothetical protein